MSQKLFVRTLITGLATSALLAGGHAAKAAEETAPVTEGQEQPQTSDQPQSDIPQAEPTTSETTDDKPTQPESTETPTSEKPQHTTEAPQNPTITEEQPKHLNTDELASNFKPTEVSKKELKKQETEDAKKDLNTANQQVKTAQEERDKAAHDKVAAEQQLKAAQSVKPTSTKQVDQKIADNTKNLNDIKSKAQTTQSQLDQKTSEVNNKEQELKKYKPTVKVTKSYTNDPVKYVEEHRFNEWTEDVVYSGTPKTVTLKEPKGKYVPNVQRVGKFVEQYINEIKRINGLSGKVKFTTNKELQKYSMDRAKEIISNQVLSHDTNLPNSDRLQGTENAGYKFDTQSLLISDEELAYSIVLSWFAEYNNLFKNYWHRTNMIQHNNDFGLGLVSDTFHGDQVFMYVYNTSGMGYEDFYKPVETEMPDGKVTYRIDEKKIKFLPKTLFKYVREEVVDHSGELKTELAQLKKEKAALDSKVSHYNNEMTHIETIISKLKQQRQHITSSNATQQKAISDAKALVTKNTKALAAAEKKLADAKKNKAAAQIALEDLTKVEKPAKPSEPVKPTTSKPAKPSEPVKPTTSKPAKPSKPVKPTTSKLVKFNSKKTIKVKMNQHKPSVNAPSKTKAGVTSKGDKLNHVVNVKKFEVPSKGIQVILPTGDQVTIPKKTVRNNLTAKPIDNVVGTTQLKTERLSNTVLANKNTSHNKAKVLPNTGQEQETKMFIGLLTMLMGIFTLRAFRRNSIEK